MILLKKVILNWIHTKKLSIIEDFSELKKAIEQVDEKYQEIVVLYYFSEMTYKEIAEVLGIPIGTALWRMKKANKPNAGYL